MKKTGIFIFIVIVTTAQLLAACGGGGTTTTPPAASVDAKALYATNCAACHGADRKGVAGLGPALTPTSLTSKSLDNVKERITEGKSGTAMPPFSSKLKPEEINALADFIKTVQP